MFENPYYPSNTPQQSGLSYYPQYNTSYNATRQPTSPPLNGRIVTSVEEARASQIALDGSQWFFPSPAENKIYAKSIGMNGMPIFLTYELQNNIADVNKQTQVDIRAYVDKEISMIVNRMNKLEEVLNNGHDATNANGINATTNQ